MLELVVPKSEQYDDDSGCFITTKEQTLRLEHSLVSLSLIHISEPTRP